MGNTGEYSLARHQTPESVLSKKYDYMKDADIKSIENR